MTVSAFTKAIFAAAALSVALPAMAGTTQKQIEDCKAQTVASTGIDLASYNLDFKSATKKKIKLELTKLDDGQTFTAVCSLRGGKVKLAETTLPAELTGAKATEQAAQ